MNSYLYIHNNNLDAAKKIVANAPAWAAEFCQIDQFYLNYEDTELEATYCESCIFLPLLEQAIADFELVEKVGGLQQAKAHINSAAENGYETISIAEKMLGLTGIGCLYVDHLEIAVIRIDKAISDPNGGIVLPEIKTTQFLLDDVVVPLGDEYGTSPNAVTVVGISGETNFKGRNSTGLEREYWYSTKDWRIANEEEKQSMCRYDLSKNENVLFKLADETAVCRGDQLYVHPKYINVAGLTVFAEFEANGDFVVTRSENGAVPKLPLSALSKKPFPDMDIKTSISILLDINVRDVTDRDVKIMKHGLKLLAEKRS